MGEREDRAKKEGKRLETEEERRERKERERKERKEKEERQVKVEVKEEPMEAESSAYDEESAHDSTMEHDVKEEPEETYVDLERKKKKEKNVIVIEQPDSAQSPMKNVEFV